MPICLPPLGKGTELVFILGTDKAFLLFGVRTVGIGLVTRADTDESGVGVGFLELLLEAVVVVVRRLLLGSICKEDGPSRDLLLCMSGLFVKGGIIEIGVV